VWIKYNDLRVTEVEERVVLLEGTGGHSSISASFLIYMQRDHFEHLRTNPAPPLLFSSILDKEVADQNAAFTETVAKYEAARGGNKIERVLKALEEGKANASKLGLSFIPLQNPLSPDPLAPKIFRFSEFLAVAHKGMSPNVEAELLREAFFKVYGVALEAADQPERQKLIEKLGSEPVRFASSPADAVMKDYWIQFCRTTQYLQLAAQAATNKGYLLAGQYLWKAFLLDERLTPYPQLLRYKALLDYALFIVQEIRRQSAEHKNEGGTKMAEAMKELLWWGTLAYKLLPEGSSVRRQLLEQYQQDITMLPESIRLFFSLAKIKEMDFDAATAQSPLPALPPTNPESNPKEMESITSQLSAAASQLRKHYPQSFPLLVN
jgi:hypothetical protein